jgi:hypothetical protein
MSEVNLSDRELEILEEIDEEIRKIDNHKVVRAAEKLLAKKARLQSARRAMLGAGNKLTSSGGNRVTREEIVEFMRGQGDESFEVSDLASRMGHSPEVIRGHFNRGKDEVFTKNADNTWSILDPEED